MFKRDDFLGTSTRIPVMLLSSEKIPLFPLPNCVVLPGASQPLHVFEPRYRRMVADLIAKPVAERFLAIALLRPGFEPQYHAECPPIHPAVCVCQITKHQALPDGRSNILVLGLCRAKVMRESAHHGYRLAALEQVATVDDLPPIEEQALRRKLAQQLQRLPAELLRSSCEIIADDTDDLERAADLIAFRLLGSEAASAKQMILAEPRLDYRVKMLLTLLGRSYARTPAISAESAWAECRHYN